MVASTPSRKAVRTSSRSVAEGAESPAAREVLLSARLWRQAESASVFSLWENESPASCLLIDLLTASEGRQLSRNGNVLLATFPACREAVLAARRLQWAMQGFCDTESRQAASLAVLIHSADEAPAENVSEEAMQFLEDAAPGTILLTEKAAQNLDRLPGFPLQAPSGDGILRLDWRAPESQSARAGDEEFLARLAEEQAALAPPTVAVERPALATEEFAVSQTTAWPRAEDSQPARRALRFWIGGGAVAALLLSGASVVLINHGRAGSNAAPVEAPVQTSTPAVARPATVNRPQSSGGASSILPPAKPAADKTAKTPPQPEVKPVPQVKPGESAASKAYAGGRCDLDPSQYSGQIDQAWKNLGRGKYNDAKREFSAVLACDGGNARAREGMERTRMAAEAEGQN